MHPELPESLGDLADPSKLTEKILLGDTTPNFLTESLKTMVLIRMAEEVIAEGVSDGLIKCPCHLAIGQEAVAVGVAAHLRSTDRAFGTHRSHSHFLAMGGTVESLFAEVLGKVTGCSHGMGGSMHLYDETKGFKGSVPIVAGTVSLAVGAAMAAKFDGGTSTDVGIAFFGDGASEEGTVHESLNIASVHKLPMLFVCENNLFSSHLHIHLRQPSDIVSRFAVGHKIAVEVVDGNDVVAVANASQRLLSLARNGQGPGFIEAVTYRWCGHVGPREDNDVGLKRGPDLIKWKQRDPIRRLALAMIERNFLSESELQTIRSDLHEEVQVAWQKALNAPYPEPNALIDLVYAARHWTSKHRAGNPEANSNFKRGKL